MLSLKKAADKEDDEWSVTLIEYNRDPGGQAYLRSQHVRLVSAYDQVTAPSIRENIPLRERTYSAPCNPGRMPESERRPLSHSQRDDDEKSAV